MLVSGQASSIGSRTGKYVQSVIPYVTPGRKLLSDFHKRRVGRVSFFKLRERTEPTHSQSHSRPTGPQGPNQLKYERAAKKSKQITAGRGLRQVLPLLPFLHAQIPWIITYTSFFLDRMAVPHRTTDSESQSRFQIIRRKYNKPDRN